MKKDKSLGVDPFSAFDKALSSFSSTGNEKNPGVGSGSFKKICMFQPHNYRLWFINKSVSTGNVGVGSFISCGHDEFAKKSSTGNVGVGSFISYGKIFEYLSKSSIGNIGRLGIYNAKYINNNKEIFFNFDQFSIRIKPKTFEVTRKKDKWYRIPINPDSKNLIQKIIVSIEKNMIEFLKIFCKFFDLKTDYKIINSHSETKLMNEDFIDSIPKKTKWRNEICKKVYNENNVEFDDPVFCANYIVNQSLKSIDYVTKKDLINVMGVCNPYNFLVFYVKNINDMLKYEKYYLLLTKKEKIRFSYWFFENI